MITKGTTGKDATGYGGKVAREDVRSAMDTAERTVHEGEDHRPDDFTWEDIDDVDEAISLWRAAEMQLAAAKVVRSVAGQVLAKVLGEGGAARIGDTIVRYKVGGTSSCIDPSGWDAVITSLINQGVLTAADLVNPNTAKVSKQPEAVRDTFYTWTPDDEASLTSLPLHRAPKFLQSLEQGGYIMRDKT